MRGHAELWMEVPERFQQMGLCALREITHEPEPSLYVEHQPPVENGVWQPAIAIMLAFKQVEDFPAQPLPRLRIGYRSPVEWSVWVRLIEAINPHSIVCG